MNLDFKTTEEIKVPDKTIDQVIGQALNCRQLRDCPRKDFVKEIPADSISECDSLRMGCFYF